MLIPRAHSDITSKSTLSEWRKRVGPLLSAVLFAAVLPQEGVASPALDYATQVGYFTAPITGSYRWELKCVAVDPSIKGQVVTARATEYPDGWMPGSMLYYPRNSANGQVIQVGDRRVVFQPRQEETVAESSSFTAAGGWGSSGPGIAHVAWALWGSPATCSATVNGSPVTVRYFDGSQAFYAGPEAFTGGPFVQNGGTHGSLARIFSADLAGGVMFAHLHLGDMGQGLLMSDDWYGEPIYECRSPNGNACGLTRPHARKLTASVVAAFEEGGGYQGELVVITLPP